MKTMPRRSLHRFFFACLALATLLGLLYAEEDWRGAHERARAERELAARGEPIQPKDLIPPFIPDHQNLAMAPIFVRTFRYQLDHRTGLVTFGPRGEMDQGQTRLEVDSVLFGPGNQSGAQSPRLSPDWTTGHRRNLIGWQTYYRQRRDFPHAAEPQAPADDILLAQSRYLAIFDELARAAAERPLARFPVNWTQRPASGINLPHCHTLQTLVAALSLRASSHLAAGQPTEARGDLDLAFRLAGAIRDEPILISHLVQISCLGSITQSLWEGLQARQWSAADLEAFGGILQGFDALRSFQQGIRGERAIFVNQTLDDLRTPAGRKEIFREADNADNELRALSWTIWLCPQGWFDLNVALGDRWVQHGIEAVDPAHGHVFLTRQNSFDSTIDTLAWRPASFALRLLMPVYHSQLLKAAQSQAALSQLVTACALERYFLAHHAYPAALTELVPAYLERVPADPVDGEPMRYRLTVDGRFQLYSIGADGKDDGGAIEWPSNRPARGTIPGDDKLWLPSPDKNKADWVWQYTPAEPPNPPENRSRLESLSTGK